MKKLKNSKTQKLKAGGFTLLELLVVIGIIALLVGIATVSYGAAQKRTRDARRKADLNAMKDALEQYYSATSFVYPTGDCKVAKTYLKTDWPVDPVSDATYTYSGTTGCAAASYCICARLETASGGNASAANCTSWANNGAYYCVGNLQ
jgi:prepilin-type N-terminal cleavage/methylation domain-containing protein